jgi:hypothetical protein
VSEEFDDDACFPAGIREVCSFSGSVRVVFLVLMFFIFT